MLKTVALWILKFITIFRAIAWALKTMMAFFVMVANIDTIEIIYSHIIQKYEIGVLSQWQIALMFLIPFVLCLAEALAIYINKKALYVCLLAADVLFLTMTFSISPVVHMIALLLFTSSLPLNEKSQQKAGL